MTTAIFYTYQDLAQLLKVHPKTVSRWILWLERERGLRVFRPTRTTVRLSTENLRVLLAQKQILGQQELL